MIEDLWYKNTVIYSLDLETFMDANGDGIGDFEGLIQRLDYLHSLGVGTIWLAPFQPTPNRDNGYIVSIADKRIYLSGDTGAIPPLRTLPNIDVAFVAMN